MRRSGVTSMDADRSTRPSRAPGLPCPDPPDGALRPSVPRVAASTTASFWQAWVSTSECRYVLRVARGDSTRPRLARRCSHRRRPRELRASRRRVVDVRHENGLTAPHRWPAAKQRRACPEVGCRIRERCRRSGGPRRRDELRDRNCSARQLPKQNWSCLRKDQSRRRSRSTRCPNAASPGHRHDAEKTDGHQRQRCRLRHRRDAEPRLQDEVRPVDAVDRPMSGTCTPIGVWCCRDSSTKVNGKSLGAMP
jgi:hypothetical protein